MLLLAACQNSKEPLASSIPVSADDSVEHIIEANHPSLLDGGPVKIAFVQSLDSRGWPSGFSMEVESVICRDVQCEIIPVLMVFDELGNFLRFELRFGDNLTKMDHIPFSQDDYAKLQQILSDRNSALRNIAADRVVTPEQAMLKKKVDGISGATALTEEGAIVKGAAYTSYTLWHWANNPEIRRQARLFTSQLASEDQLIEMLSQGSEGYLHFAIQQLIAGNYFRKDVRSAVTAELLSGRDRTVKPVMEYLEAATIATGQPYFFMFVQSRYLALQNQTRVRILEALKETSLDAPDGFMDGISGWLPKLETYYEVHLLLELLDAKNPGSQNTTRQAIQLLDNNNFLIARRAFWFLEERELNPAQSALIKRFRSEYEDRL
ncbi:MAG: hypothetical protein AB3N63_02580 [Puniceicoccaceae bacterium]